MPIKWLENRRDALTCWRKIFSYSYEPPREENIILAGRRGEAYLKEYISTHEIFKDCDIFYCKRLENGDKKCKNEIDMIIVSGKKIYALECKNWNGKVTIDKGVWEYTTHDADGKLIKRRCGTKCDSPDPVTLLKEKSKLLYTTLKKYGADISKNQITSKVIFINKNMQIENWQEEKDIIVYNELEEYMRNGDLQENYLFGIVISILKLFLRAESVSKLNNILDKKFSDSEKAKIVECLDSLPAWDYVRLSPCNAFYGYHTDNVKVYQGDIIKYTDFFKDYIQNIKDIKKIKVNKPTSQLLSLLKIIFGIYPLTLQIIFSDNTKEEYEANPDGSILFQEAGKCDPINIPILQIGEIEINSKTRPIWNDKGQRNWLDKLKRYIPFRQHKTVSNS